MPTRTVTELTDSDFKYVIEEIHEPTYSLEAKAYYRGARVPYKDTHALQFYLQNGGRDARGNITGSYLNNNHFDSSVVRNSININSGRDFSSGTTYHYNGPMANFTSPNVNVSSGNGTLPRSQSTTTTIDKDNNIVTFDKENNNITIIGGGYRGGSSSGNAYSFNGSVTLNQFSTGTSNNMSVSIGGGSGSMTLNQVSTGGSNDMSVSIGGGSGSMTLNQFNTGGSNNMGVSNYYSSALRSNSLGLEFPTETGGWLTSMGNHHVGTTMINVGNNMGSNNRNISLVVGGTRVFYHNSGSARIEDASDDDDEPPHFRGGNNSGTQARVVRSNNTQTTSNSASVGGGKRETSVDLTKSLNASSISSSAREVNSDSKGKKLNTTSSEPAKDAVVGDSSDAAIAESAAQASSSSSTLARVEEANNDVQAGLENTTPVTPPIEKANKDSDSEEPFDKPPYYWGGPYYGETPIDEKPSSCVDAVVGDSDASIAESAQASSSSSTLARVEEATNDAQAGLEYITPQVPPIEDANNESDSKEPFDKPPYYWGGPYYGKTPIDKKPTSCIDSDCAICKERRKSDANKEIDADATKEIDAGVQKVSPPPKLEEKATKDSEQPSDKPPHYWGGSYHDNKTPIETTRRRTRIFTTVHTTPCTVCKEVGESGESMIREQRRMSLALNPEPGMAKSEPRVYNLQSLRRVVMKIKKKLRRGVSTILRREI